MTDTPRETRVLDAVVTLVDSLLEQSPSSCSRPECDQVPSDTQIRRWSMCSTSPQMVSGWGTRAWAWAATDGDEVALTTPPREATRDNPGRSARAAARAPPIQVGDSQRTDGAVNEFVFYAATPWTKPHHCGSPRTRVPSSSLPQTSASPQTGHTEGTLRWALTPMTSARTCMIRWPD